jgi:ADP-ribose pyrophosphatase YjhB (NUDIX family)
MIQKNCEREAREKAEVKGRRKRPASVVGFLPKNPKGLFVRVLSKKSMKRE